MRSAEQKSKQAAQQLIPVKEIRDGIAILSDGTLRSTLIVSSLNFALKSEEEQNAIIYAYQDFLNSLDFPIQITINSRRLDITPYLEELRARRDGQKNELLRLQMNEYSNFISELVKGHNIMSKTFLVTVSFSAQQSKQTKFKDRFKLLKGRVGKKDQGRLDDATFDQYRKQLLQRVEQVAVGLRGMGLRLAPLQTQELLELLYTSLNPTTSRNQRLRNVAQLQTEETEPDRLIPAHKKDEAWVSSSKSN